MQHTPGDLVVEAETRHPHQEQTFKVVSLAEKKANEWRKDWYWPAVLHGLTKPQADLFAAAPDLLAACEALLSVDEISDRRFCPELDALRVAIVKARGQ